MRGSACSCQGGLEDPGPPWQPGEADGESSQNACSSLQLRGTAVAQALEQLEQRKRWSKLQRKRWCKSGGIGVAQALEQLEQRKRWSKMSAVRCRCFFSWAQRSQSASEAALQRDGHAFDQFEEEQRNKKTKNALLSPLSAKRSPTPSKGVFGVLSLKNMLRAFVS